MHIIDKRKICKQLFHLNVFSLRKIAVIVGVSHMSVKRWSTLDDEIIEKNNYHHINHKKQKSTNEVVLALKSIIKANPLLLLDEIQNKIYELS